ncbi:hypothetical protein [Croceicoccus sp. Ery15]|uniref:hypothetical protein n=1 Tax=Croceicoccus sp. Ery15 TaxID=1703338 RepID=UPI001E332A94|nr:hypothetical protein [Croceicoccus sp. Ery15]
MYSFSGDIAGCLGLAYCLLSRSLDPSSPFKCVEFDMPPKDGNLLFDNRAFDPQALPFDDPRGQILIKDARLLAHLSVDFVEAILPRFQFRATAVFCPIAKRLQIFVQPLA